MNELSLDSSTSQQGLLNEVWVVLWRSTDQFKNSGEGKGEESQRSKSLVHL